MEQNNKDVDLTEEQAKQFLSTLAHLQLRPQVYASEEHFGIPALDWIHGFTFGLRLVGIAFDDEIEQVRVERGYEISAFHPIRQMREQGMSEDECLEETVQMLIEAVKRKYSLSNEPIEKVRKMFRDAVKQSIENIDTQPNLSEGAKENQLKRLKEREDRINRIDKKF